MIRDMLLVLGLLLTVTTQLRFPNILPIGPGETLLFAWLLLTLGRNLYRLDVPLPPASLHLLTFWLLLVVALSVGTMTAYVIGDIHDASLFRHDIMAYVLMAGIGFFCVIEPQAETRLRKISWLLIVFGSLFLALQLAHASGIVNFPSFEPWYWHRFRGWSENSNTLAMLCLAIAWLSVYLAETSIRFGEKIVAVGCMILPILCGILTDSDAFKMALIASVALFVATKSWKVLYSKSRKLRFFSLSALLVMLVLPVFLALAVATTWMLPIAYEGNNAIVSSKKFNDLKKDARVRFQLWEQALKRGIDSGMLGLGPGPHLARPYDDRKASEMINMDLGPPAPRFEAHNTPLDLLVQGGALAVVSFFWLGTTAAIISLRAGKQALVALMLGIAFFGVTHFIVRAPIVWFVVAFCLVATEAKRRPLQAEAWT